MNWKTIAIISLILLFLSWFFIGWLFYEGTRIAQNKAKCSFNICESGGYDSFYYDEFENMCYCYKDNEMVYRGVVE